MNAAETDSMMATAIEQTPTLKHIETFITKTKTSKAKNLTYRPTTEVQEILKAGLIPVWIKRAADKSGRYLKHPTNNGWNKIVYPTEGELDDFIDKFDAPVNYGVLTGGKLASGLFLTVIDVDAKNNGLQHFADLIDFLGLDFASLTQTLTCVTQSGGLHFYFGTKVAIAQKQGLDGAMAGIDTRSVGGQVVGGGSVMKDADGNTTWYSYNQDADYQILDCPEELEEYLVQTFAPPVVTKGSATSVAKRTRKKDEKLFTVDPTEVEEGDRHRYLLSLAGHLSRTFDTFVEYEAELLSCNAKLTMPKTNKKELADILAYGWGDKPQTPLKPVIRSYRFVKKVIPVETANSPVENRIEYVTEMLKSCQENDAFLLPLKDRKIVAYAQSQDESPILLGLGEGTITIIQDGNTLLNYLSDYYDVDLLPVQHSSYNLTPARYLDYLRQKAWTMGVRYTAVSIVPEHEPQPETLYLCPEVKPENTGLFRELMNVFTFLTPNDKYKFSAAMLSLLLNTKWIRELPLLMMRAGIKSAGKTKVVQISAKLIQGQTPIPMKGNEKDADRFNSLTTMGNRVCLYDNLTNPDNRTLDQITINITSDILDMHVMHVQHGKVRNNKLHTATINADSALNDDVIERSMPCHMSATVTEAQRLRISTYLQKCQDDPTFTTRLQSDMLYWMGQGDRFDGIVEYNCPPKVGMWAQKLAPVVYAVFEDEFTKPYINFAADEDDREKSREYMSGKLTIADLWASHGVEHDFFFASFDEFKSVMNEQNLTGAALRNRIGRWLVSFAGKVNIEYKPTKKARGYTIEILKRDFFAPLVDQIGASDLERRLMDAFEE